MASIVQNQEDDKNQQEQGTVNVSSAPTQTTAGGVGASSQANAGRKTSGSGRFTNIQKYLQAAGTDAGGKIAGQIGQNVTKQTDKLGQAVSSAQNINPQIEAERQRIAQASGFAQDVQNDPTKITGDQSKAQAFGQIYSGQSELGNLQNQAQQSFNTAQSQLGNVQNLAGLTGTEAGRFELLRQSLGRPSYTRGQQKLDQLLLQTGGGDVLGNLQRDTAAKAMAGENLLGTARTGIESNLSQLGTDVTSGQQSLQAALGGYDDPTTEVNEATGAFGNLQTGLTTKANEQQAKFQDMYDRARAGLAKGEIDRDVAEMLGLTGIQTGVNIAAPGMAAANSNLNQIVLGKNITPEDLLSRLQRGFTTVTPSGVASEQDYARLQALKQLSGQTGVGAFELDKNQLGQTGKAAVLDAQKLQQDVQSSLNQLQDKYKGLSVSGVDSLRAISDTGSKAIGELLKLSDNDLTKAFGGGDPKALRKSLQTQASTFNSLTNQGIAAASRYSPIIQYGMANNPEYAAAALDDLFKRYGTVGAGGVTGTNLMNALSRAGIGGGSIQNMFNESQYGAAVNKEIQDAYDEFFRNSIKIK